MYAQKMCSFGAEIMKRSKGQLGSIVTRAIVFALLIRGQLTELYNKRIEYNETQKINCLAF